MTWLPDFAPELIIHVFESLDTFQAIAALRSTSQKFNGIWRSKIVHISKANRLHAIDCLPDAEDLLKIQGHSPAEGTDICQSALEHNKRLFPNAKKVLQDSKAFEKHSASFRRGTPDGIFILPDRHRVKRRTKAQVTSSIHFYYRVWTMVDKIYHYPSRLGSEGASDLLGSKSYSAKELGQLQGIIGWISRLNVVNDDCFRALKAPLVIAGEASRWDTAIGTL